MNTIQLRPAEPERDFGQIAAWFKALEDEPNTEEGLKEEFEREKERIIQKVAENEQGELLGFYWTFHSKLEEGRIYLNLFVKPEQRRQGTGSRLYKDMEQALESSQAKKLRVSIPDTCPECRGFAERRGFIEKSHGIAMRLDLTTFDDSPYDEIIARLEGEGFRFTSMEAMGDTEEAQRKLYVLNDTTDMDAPSADNTHSWTSFEDFQKQVCQADWYKPAGQMVVIDASDGTWAAMSAISRFEDYAYNLHTGVDRRYRGRKLAQAVKVKALRYARDVLEVDSVHTHHNAKNLPMIAIDRKLGYIQMPGTYLMEKNLSRVSMRT